MSLIQYLQKFYNWWITGLLAAVPESLRQRIIEYPDRLIIEFDEQNIIMAYYNGNSNELIDKKIINQEDELEKASTSQWLTQIKSDHTECIVLLPQDKILEKSLDLPLSSENDVREILGFEMDRQTPFSVDQVYYDFRLISRDTENEKISLDLFVATRDYIDSIIAGLRSWSLKVAVVSFRNGDSPARINLLPVEARAIPDNKLDPLTLIAGTCTFFLFIAALYIPMFQQLNILDELESEMDRSRAVAREVQPLITEKEAILERTRFLMEKRQSKISVIEILAELTNILPDETYLNRLTIREDEIQIYGESDTATSILQFMENSDYFHKAQPRSPVTKNNATNKEKFHVSATLAKQSAS